jgi:hypothetical protein
MNRYLVTAIAMAAIFASGCGSLRGGGRRTPAAPPRVLQLPPVAAAAPNPLPEPPAIEPEPVEISQLPAAPEPELPDPPARPRRRVPSHPAGEQTVASVPEPPPAATQPQVPQLAQILTPEQQQNYNAAIERNLDRARRTVAALAKRRLSGNQAVYLERINSFILESAEARKTDLVRAASLAERAAVLSDDLARSVQ